MATDITMPKLSDTMTEGRFGSWRKQVGERVERGEIIAEVETDKAVMELESFVSGVLLEQRALPGETVAVGTVIGRIGQPGEQSESRDGTPIRSEAPPVELVGIGPERVLDGDQPAGSLPRIKADTQAEQAAPVVRRRAREMGIDLALVPGSGPGGRILLEDLERFSGVSIATAAPLPATALAEAAPPASAVVLDETAPSLHQGEPESREALPLSRMRAAIARTVSEAWQTIPHFYLAVEVAMDAAVEVRRELQGGGTNISLNDFFTRAAAMALVKYPLLNARFAGDRLILQREINIGIAVALPEGLLIPVLEGCAGLTLKEIATRSRTLVARARAGQLSSGELQDGTFTISNLGRYGVTAFSAVIHPGQAAILAVGAVRDAVVVRNGVPAVGKLVTLTLAADHRLVDGAYAAEFVQEIRATLEAPVRMLV